MSFADSLKREARLGFYGGHKAVAIAMITIVFLLPFVGLSMMGVAGAALGVVVSALVYYLTPYLWLKLAS